MSDILQLSKRQKNLYNRFYKSFSEELTAFYKANQEKSFAVLLSGGYDSRFILYACLDLGIPVGCCYSFSLEDRDSTDSKLAEEICKIENIPFQRIRMPVKADLVIETMELLAKEYKCRKKTEFECTMPMYYIFQSVTEDVILRGNCSDNYFALDRDYALHFKNVKDGLTKFKEKLFNEDNIDQKLQIELLSEKYSKLAFDPFDTESVFDSFKNTTWQELNTPHVKGPLYSRFKDRFDSIKPYHANYQCGDTGIRELCADVLLQSDYNRKNYKSVVGCYNEIVRSVNRERRKRKSLI